MYIYILYMQVLNECHTVSLCPAGWRLYTCIYVHVLFVAMHTHGRACTMYIYILYMQVLNECHTVSLCPAGWRLYTCIYVHVLFVAMHTHGRACTMYIYILYSQVLNECLAASDEQELVSWDSLYTSTCIYSCVLCSCMHTHGVQCTYTLFKCRLSMDVSQLVTDRIGVLKRPYTSTCIYRCWMDVLQLVTDGIGVLLVSWSGRIHLHVFTGAQWMSRASNRQNW
jgi:hypothetical protein